MDHSIDQQSTTTSLNMSQDMLDVTGFENPSPGPALVSNSSLDSPLTLAPAPATGQRPSQSDTIIPGHVAAGEPVSSSAEVAIGRDSTTPKGPLEGGDFANPAIREARAYADDLTRELLNETDNLVRTTQPNIADTAREIVDSAIVQATETISSHGLESNKVEMVDENEPSLANLEDGKTKAAVAANEEPMVESEQKSAVEEGSAGAQPIVKVKTDRKPSVVIGSATLYFDEDSLDESKPQDQSNRGDCEQKGHIYDEDEVEQKEMEEKTDVKSLVKNEDNDSYDNEENKENARVGFEDKKDRDTRAEEVEVEEKSDKQNKQADESLIKLNDITNNELLYQTFKTAANTSQDSQQLDDDKSTASIMEFTKNYSDDLLMGEQRGTASGGSNNESGGHDLADFELPPYTGSSSGSEQATTTTTTTAKHSPTKQRKSSKSEGTQASSSSNNGRLAPSDLTAVKNIIISTYSRVAHVLHWKRPIESGIIFAIGLMLIAALTFFSIISVVAYSAIGVVLFSGMVRVYKTSMTALGMSSETPVDHIWEKVLGLNVSMSPERMHELIDSSHANLNASLVYCKQVLLVEDKVATMKFFLFLYSLTYIGAWFNGLTLITIIYVTMFTAPKLYEKNKTKIDEYLNLATSQMSSAISMATGKVSALAFGSQPGAEGSKKKN